MKKRRRIFGPVLLSSASFAGYNIGSGFATGTESLQFFGAWGAKSAFVCVTLSFLIAMVVLSAVYLTGYEQKFQEPHAVYTYFFGRTLGRILEFYVYFSTLCITLTLMSGAGATIHQFTGLPVLAGALIMALLCGGAALLGLSRLMRVLSYLSLFIIVFVVGCGVYALFAVHAVPASAAQASSYAATGQILRDNAFGVQDPWLCSISSASLLVSSGFAWVAATGGLCRSKKEAVCSGLFSSLFYYATTAIAIYLILLCLDQVAGAEVPMLAVVQHLFPALSALYSLIIVLAIFSTVSGRLFLLSDRYAKGAPWRRAVLIFAVMLLSIAGAVLIPFSKISNVIYSTMGALGIFLSIFILIRFFLDRAKKAVPSEVSVAQQTKL